MHGLIFETSIWLLAGSTRFVLNWLCQCTLLHTSSTSLMLTVLVCNSPNHRSDWEATAKFASMLLVLAVCLWQLLELLMLASNPTFGFPLGRNTCSNLCLQLAAARFTAATTADNCTPWEAVNYRSSLFVNHCFESGSPQILIVPRQGPANAPIFA